MIKNLHRTFEMTMPNMDVFTFPVHIVASHRARYHLSLRNKSLNTDRKVLTEEEYYTEEFLLALDATPEELLLWATKNMSWEDIRPYAEMVPTPPTNYKNLWKVATFKVNDT